jgi:CBS domain-containing protein
MRIGIVPTRRTVCIDCDASVADACRLMRHYQLGELVVTEKRDATDIPTGIISARDIVTRIVAVELDPAVVTVGDILWICSRPATPADSVPETIARLSASGCEALPVLDIHGNVSGILSLDDLLLAIVSGRPLARSNAG